MLLVFFTQDLLKT